MGTLFEQTFNNIRKNRSNKLEGKYNSIPFGLPGLDRHVPGIMRGIVYSIVAGSGVGKTQLAKYLFVLQPYKFVKQHPHLNIKLKIIYFALEESREEFMLNLICNRLKEEYRINISSLELRSMGEYTLDEDIMDKVSLCQEYFEDLEQYLDIVENVYNPTGKFLKFK